MILELPRTTILIDGHLEPHPVVLGRCVHQHRHYPQTQITRLDESYPICRECDTDMEVELL